MISRKKKIAIILTATILLAGLMAAAVSAQSETPPAATPEADDCASCHPESYVAWHKGGHGDIQAGVVRQQEMNCSACHKGGALEAPSLPVDESGQTIQDPWLQEGRPPLCLGCHSTGYDPATGKSEADGITCKACHGELREDHPTKQMPAKDALDQCRECHTETRFNWNSWGTSIHYQAKLKCSTCHDPHTTSLKIVGGGEAGPSELCINCHKDQAQDSQHSIHARRGIVCVDCHLGSRKGTDDFHMVPDHSFVPALETCNGCHAEQMHGNGTALDPNGTPVAELTETSTPEPLITPVPTDVTSSPAPANLAAVTGMIGLLGLLGGVIVRSNFRKS